MSLTRRQLSLRRAVLLVARDFTDARHIAPEDLLRGEAARLTVPPTPTTAELDEAIRGADAARLILGVSTDEGVKWKLTDAGRAWLAEHP